RLLPRFVWAVLPCAVFFFHVSAPHPDLHSFPTRRSSDLHRTQRTVPRMVYVRQPRGGADIWVRSRVVHCLLCGKSSRMFRTGPREVPSSIRRCRILPSSRVSFGSSW